MAGRGAAGMRFAGLRRGDAGQPRAACRSHRAVEGRRRSARSVAHRALCAELDRRRSLEHPARGAAAGLRNRAGAGGFRGFAEPAAASGRRQLRARRHGAEIRSPSAADRVALGRHADRRLCQRAGLSLQSARCDLLRDRRRHPVAGRDPRRRQPAVRFPDRAPQPGRLATAGAAGDVAAMESVARRLTSVVRARSDRLVAACGRRRRSRGIRDRQRRSQSIAERHRLRGHAVADDFRRHLAETPRGLVSPAVRQQPDADVGVRRCNHPVPQRQRRRGPALRLQPKGLPRHEAARHLAARTNATRICARCSGPTTTICPTATGGI